MSCTDIHVTVYGSASGIIDLMDKATQAVTDAESARDEAFGARDDADKHEKAAQTSADAAKASAQQAATAANAAKSSETAAKKFADDSETAKVGAAGAMAQAKVYRDQAKQFAGQRTPIEIKQDGASKGVGVSELNFAGATVAKTADGAYKITVAAPSVTWASLSGKPSTFPPATHQHAISDVTGLQAALDAKQPKGEYATTAQLGQKLDSSTYNADKAKFAKLDQANTFAKMITLEADGVADTDVANVRTVKDLIASQAAVQANSDGLLKARVLTLENEEPASLNLTTNDADKTITIKLLAKGKTVASGTVDISGMFEAPSQPAAVAQDLYFGFSTTGTPSADEVKAGIKRSVTKVDGQALEFVRSDKTPAFLYAWIPDALGAVRGFSSGGFVDVWQSSALTIDGVLGKLFVSDNKTATDSITLEVKA